MSLFLETDEKGEFKDFHWVRAIAAILVVGWILSAISFGLDVATAGIVGRGEAHIQQQSAGNRIASQTRFYQDLTSIVKYNQMYIDTLQSIKDWDVANGSKKDDALGHLAKQRADLDQSANGIRQQCQNVIADYNLAGAAYLSKDFKDEGLPDTAQINDFCQGNEINLSKYPGLAKLGAAQ